jgi:hypothetical protein
VAGDKKTPDAETRALLGGIKGVKVLYLGPKEQDEVRFEAGNGFFERFWVRKHAKMEGFTMKMVVFTMKMVIFTMKIR